MKRVRKFVDTFLTQPSTTSDSDNVFGSKNFEISEVKILFQVPDLTNFGEDKTTSSATAFVRYLPWTIMLKLNAAEDGTNKSMSAFVLCDYNVNSSWSCATKISLTLLSSKSNKNHSMAFDHCFERDGCCKGFDPFILWSELIDPQNGYMENNKIVIEVTMKCDEPKCVPWNSRKHTKCVGLEDKTENSFLNSIIQILYFVESFRVSMDVALSSENEVPTQNLIRELQQIFRQLKSSEEPVSIDPFIKSMGNRVASAIKTHDSEYFFNFLLKMLRKNGSTKHTSDLFHGQMSNLSTSTGKFEITELRKFNGLKLEICADSDIDELLNKYFASNSCIDADSPMSLIEVSTLYRWFYSLLRWTNPANSDDRTSVQFEKHIEITQLPSILIVHLDRQQDFISEQHFELKFCKHISLSKFAKKHVGDSASTKYVLHAVLVRRATSFSAFINVNNSDIGWLKFDNAIVSHCTEKEAIDDTFRCVQMLVYSKCGRASSKKDANDETAFQLKCIICMEATTSSGSVFSTICGHVFCGPCIKMELSLRQKCPVCKSSLTEKNIHPIFF